MNLLPIITLTIKCIIYGSSIFFTRQLTASTDVLDVLSLRFLMSFVVMVILKELKILKIQISIKDIFVKNNRTKYIKNLIFAALFEPVLYMLFETFGISMTTGITAGVILAFAPIVACLMEVIMLKDKGSWLKYFFIILGIAGVLYITFKTDTSSGENTVWGIVFMFLAVISGVLFTVFVKKSSAHFESFEISYISCVFGTVFFNAVNIIRHIINGNLSQYFVPYMNADNMIGFVFLAICSTILATACGNYALSKVHVSTAAAFGGLSTVVTVIIGVVFENETLYMFHYIGFALILIRILGVLFVDKREERKNKALKA